MPQGYCEQQGKRQALKAFLCLETISESDFYGETNVQIQGTKDQRHLTVAVILTPLGWRA